MENQEIIKSVQFGDYRSVRDYIEGHVYSSNTTDNDNCTLLHWAAINNRIEIAKFLIGKNASVNQVGGYLQETPLHWAIRKNFYRVMKLLIDHNADATIKSNLRVDSIQLACQLGNLNTIFLLLTWDRKHEKSDYDVVGLFSSLFEIPFFSADIIRMILKESRLDVFKSSSETGDNVLHLISRKTSSEISPEVIWAFWSRNESLIAKHHVNHEDKTPYQISVEKRDFFMFRFFWDLYLYHNFPKWLPTFAICCSLITPCIFIPLLGWLYGIISSIILWIFFDMLSQRNIPPQSSRYAQGIAWGLLCVIVIEYWFYVQQNIVDSTSTYIFYLLAGLSACSMFQISRTKSSRAEFSDREDIITRIIATSPQEGPNEPHTCTIPICPSCLVVKENTSVHCSVCDVCQNPLLDHHCAFLNNCIGEGNRRLFCLFLLITCTATTFCCYLTFQSTFQHCQFDLNKDLFKEIAYYHHCLFKSHFSLEVLFSLTFFVSFWLFMLLLGQLLSVAYETTVFEINRRRNVRKWFTLLRMFYNLKKFILTGQYKITRSDGDSEISFSTSSSSSSSHSHSHSYHYNIRNPSSEETQELLFNQNESLSSVSSSHRSFNLSAHGTRYREGSFDLEMGGNSIDLSNIHKDEIYSKKK